MFFPYRDDNPRVLVPYITYLLLFINCSFFLIQTLSPKELTMVFAIIPKMSSLDFSHFVLSLFTSMFLHGSLIHLIGNMLYLWIFADNVEGVLGHWKFAIFYVSAGLSAGIIQSLVDLTSTIPIVGASGAIAGVLAAYMIFFPNAKVHTLIFIFFYFTTVRIPALFLLGFWLIMQISNGLSVLGVDTTGGVAWFAHIGGFVTGLILILLLKKVRTNL
ncbi:MAG: rhomboid family intramembrane serine protease [Candidatus Marinimicrobia bacterium]|nr:rhomboid family intramembrane serine protease [Candidatus Neomarinimicrobiota bacterium]|tara:strand:- start:899 stop:1549 length:651 start_codon:yes stop_codon:yes gene_type:complete